MNPLKKNIILLLLLVISISCDDPSPIEIIDEEEVVLSVVNEESDTYVITGYDSTGISEEDLSKVSIISLSGIKNTFEKITTYRAYSEAVFFDTTKPVINNSNRLIGYKTIDVGTVKFDNRLANIVPFFLQFRENFIKKDTLLGQKHTISYTRVLQPDQLNFNYNKIVQIELISKQGISNKLSMRVPDEIIGKVEITGNNIKRNKKIVLSWKRSDIFANLSSDVFSEEIIVGGISSDRDELVPLLRAGELLSNRLEIPNSLVKEVLASGRFEYIVFTFLRKIRKSNSTSRLGDIYFASQSIHNIWVKI
jgi:hypothetical protein